MVPPRWGPRAGRRALLHQLHRAPALDEGAGTIVADVLGQPGAALDGARRERPGAVVVEGDDVGEVRWGRHDSYSARFFARRDRALARFSFAWRSRMICSTFA